MFSSCYMLFPTFLEKQISGGGGVNKNGGGGVKQIYFLEKQFFLISFHVLCYFQHLKKKCYYFPSHGPVSFITTYVLIRMIKTLLSGKNAIVSVLNSCVILLSEMTRRMV